MEPLLEELKLGAVAISLRKCQLFTGVPAPDLAEVARLAVVKSLTRGEYLFHEGDASPGFYVVQKGAINVHRVGPGGREQVICVFRPGDSFAEATLAGDRGYPADARAVEPSQVLLVKRAGFIALLARRPELALRMLGAMSAHLRVLVGQLDDLTLKDVETRLANWLLRRCPTAESDVPVTLQIQGTKRMLAAELGTVSETFSRTLARFREQGLVSVRGNQLTVLKPLQLRALLRRNLAE